MNTKDTHMTFSDLLAAIRPQVLIEFSGKASLADYNPAAQWLAKACVNELRRRNGEPQQRMEPLMLDETEADFAREWLDGASAIYGDSALEHDDADLLRLGALLGCLREQIDAASPASLQ